MSKNRCVVRLRSSAWADRKGVYVKKTLSYMRKYSHGANIIEEEIDGLGPMEAITRITNIAACADGLYEVVPYNLSYDWETGYMDNCDLRLEPFEVTK